MDATERIEKINAMSQELKKFGFFEDNNEIVEEAKNDYSSEYNQNQVFSAEDNALQELNQNFKEFKNITHSKIDEMSKEMLSLHSQIKELIETVSELNTRKEIPPQKEPSPSIPEKKIQRPISENPPQNQDANTVETQEEKPYYEKQGHFTSEDVKIENIFYCGQKQ
ncbi:hypothetical protein ACFLTH_13600 [Bacteroidota bacterium]